MPLGLAAMTSATYFSFSESEELLELLLELLLEELELDDDEPDFFDFLDLFFFDLQGKWIIFSLFCIIEIWLWNALNRLFMLLKFAHAMQFILHVQYVQFFIWCWYCSIKTRAKILFWIVRVVDGLSKFSLI